MIGTTLNQRFSLDKELGRGGMGSVYRATDLVLQRPVAIKVLKERTGEEVARRIRLEAQILARLVHEHIVRIYDFGEAEGLYYFVMEEVDGSSYFRRSRTLDFPGRLRVLAQVAEALDYAHHQGVIHRDVKPANVLLTRSDSARLSDFGLSVLMDGVQESGTVRGTPSYMSPEQAKGRRLDHRTDLYSLGVMLYEGATGSTPFTGPSLAVIAGHASGTPEPPRTKNPALSAEVEALILKLMEKSPERRPASGSAVAETIRALLAADPTLGGASGPPSSSSSISAVVSVPGTPSGTRMIATGSGDAATVGASPTGISPASRPEETRAGDARPLAARMVEDVLDRPVPLTPDARYLIGHYLAYLLGGSRRRGFFRRRPLDPLNADRARLVLAMTWLMASDASGSAVAQAAALIDQRPDVRPLLTPVVVVKYVDCRSTPAKRRGFREARRRLQAASAYARDHMTDVRGVLNPGLMPQVVEDLQRIAPTRTEVDDRLVERWNRVADAWRDRPDFRQAVLRYATTGAFRDPASAGLWPEVVYPLIERAQWQRQLRSTPEVVLDGVLAALRLPDAGNRLDRAIRTVVPARVVQELEADLAGFVDEPILAIDDAPAEANADDPADRLSLGATASQLDEMTSSHTLTKSTVRLAGPDPIRLTLGELKALHDQGLAGLRTPGQGGARPIPIGPYRLAVIPSIRGRSAGQVAIQGMRGNKQIEFLTPSLRLAGTSGKPIVAAWVYTDDSLAIAYVDFRNAVRYISWHAPAGHQENYDGPADLNHALLNLGLEAPDGLGLALSRRFRPKNRA